MRFAFSSSSGASRRSAGGDSRPYLVLEPARDQVTLPRRAGMRRNVDCGTSRALSQRTSVRHDTDRNNTAIRFLFGINGRRD
ncbi:hypothetical protein [Burkholderia cenocepacia]|uniref:hypothetical protein n=1 Tax=Burkholderia cenocepacia TaxID=95486 RepID=UPI002AB26172|nr:hypothetical protein [Burkholderia cenocepacia]